MINLITGGPGAGKTSYGLKFMLDQLRGSNRKIYVHGIPDLKIPHERVYCRSKTCDYCSEYDQDNIHPSLLVENWHIYAPVGAVYFLDECQHVYRKRPPSSAPPDSVKSFEHHRHKGLDFFLITQSPKLIDHDVRELVTRHIHLITKWASRFQYEWPECKTDTSAKADAIKSKYSLDKKTFDLYSSASLHTKQDRKIPNQFYYLIAMIIAIALVTARVYARIGQRTTKQTPTEIQQTPLRAQASKGVDPSIPSATFSTAELIGYSYHGIAASEIDELPATCYPHTRTSYKCIVPKVSSRSYRSSYCVNDACFVLLPVQIDKG